MEEQELKLDKGFHAHICQFFQLRYLLEQGSRGWRGILILAFYHLLKMVAEEVKSLSSPSEQF